MKTNLHTKMLNNNITFIVGISNFKKVEAVVKMYLS